MIIHIFPSDLPCLWVMRKVVHNEENYVNARIDPFPMIRKAGWRDLEIYLIKIIFIVFVKPAVCRRYRYTPDGTDWP